MSWEANEYAMKRAEMGLNGVDVFADTNTHAGKWCKIEVQAAAVLNALTSNWSAAPAGTLPVGAVLRGYFTSIDLTSGTVWAYRTDEAQS